FESATIGSPSSNSSGMLSFLPICQTKLFFDIAGPRYWPSRSVKPARSRCRLGIAAIIATEYQVGGCASGLRIVLEPERTNGFSARGLRRNADTDDAIL